MHKQFSACTTADQLSWYKISVQDFGHSGRISQVRNGLCIWPQLQPFFCRHSGFIGQSYLSFCTTSPSCHPAGSLAFPVEQNPPVISAGTLRKRGIPSQKQGPEWGKMLRIRAVVLSWNGSGKGSTRETRECFSSSYHERRQLRLDTTNTWETVGWFEAVEGLTQPPGQQGWKCWGWPAVAIWVTQRQ